MWCALLRVRLGSLSFVIEMVHESIFAPPKSPELHIFLLLVCNLVDLCWNNHKNHRHYKICHTTKVPPELQITTPKYYMARNPARNNKTIPVFSHSHRQRRAVSFRLCLTEEEEKEGWGMTLSEKWPVTGPWVYTETVYLFLL